MLPEEKARVKIDKQLNNAGWDIVDRKDYLPNYAMAVKEALMQGGKESDYLLFVDNKAIGVVEAKKESDSLGPKVASQAEHYAKTPQNWYGLWFQGLIPLVYLANGNKIYFKNMLTDSDGDYVELGEMHSPKKMLQLIGKKSEYGALPRIEKRGLRDCQYDAEVNLEKSLKQGKKKALAVLATGSGKTYLACLASYRLLNYTSTKRVLFLVDRNNLARQTETEFSLFDRTENQQPMSSLYQINRLKNKDDIGGDIVISTIQKLFAVLTGQTITDDDEDKEDEKFFSFKDTDSNQTVVSLGNDLKLPPDYFQFIIIDECHRSIYGKWQSVLNYFKGATILGLTATPTPEAYAFFNDNIIEKYTYDDSVVDGVNVPARVYRIKSNITEHGGTINTGDEVVEITRSGKEIDSYTATGRIDFAPTQLDRSVIVPDQMRKVLTAYKDSMESVIFKGDDNSYYEKIGDSVACIDAELPFEIPDNWCWARLNCISINYDSYRKPINSYDRKNRVLGKSKDELYPYYGATGQIGFIDDFLFNGEYILLGEDAAPFLDKKAQKAYMIKGKSWVNNHAHILQSLVFPEYLTNCLNSIDYFDYVYGTTRLKLTQENMNRILVPVPSIEEQCKIAQAINNLFVLIESIKASLS